MRANVICVSATIVMCLLIAGAAGATTFSAFSVTDQTPTAPLANPTPGGFQPRYMSGFGTNNTFTVFFEDRDAANLISYAATTTGPTGFPASPTGTTIIPETHFCVKDWPINVGGTDYDYRAWGSVGNNMDHVFYVSNDLVNWAVVDTFTITNHVSFTGARGWVYYGFHDVILLNGTYYAFGESNQGQTMLVRSANGDEVWEAFASVGGTVAGDGPLQMPESATPSGSFVDLGHDRGYGNLQVRGNDAGCYLAVNYAAKPSLAPGALETAFINPANWTWDDGSTGLPTVSATPVLLQTGEHDVRECWVVPNSDPDADWVIMYDADFGVADGGKALGYATLTPPPPPPVHNITQGIDYMTIQAGVDAANPGDVIECDAGTYTEYVIINIDDLTIVGAGIDQSIIDFDGVIPYWHYTGSGSYSNRGGVLISGYGNTDGETELVEGITFSGFTVKNAGLNVPITASGAHTGGDDSAILTDAGASWTPGALVGEWVHNYGDKDSDNDPARSYGQITANTATTVTTTLTGGVENDWDNGDTYKITPYESFYDAEGDDQDDLTGIQVGSGKNVTIQNCKIEYNGSRGIRYGRARLGDRKASENPTVTGCRITNNTTTGIAIGDTEGTATITGNTVSDNLHADDLALGRHTKGMQLSGRSNTQLLTGTISGNTVSGNRYHGINVYRYTDGFVVENNNVTGHNLHWEGAGIFVNTGWGFTKDCKNHTVRNNTVTGNIRGIVVYFAWGDNPGDLTIEGNTITTDAGTHETGQAAIKIDCGYNLAVRDNTISCDGVGMRVHSTDSHDNTFTDNTVDGAMFAGIYVTSGAHDNTFTGNTIKNTTSDTFTQYADWGTHTGGDNEVDLTDNTKSWTPDAFVGFEVLNLTDGSSGAITANTATTVTAMLSGGTEDDWDTADEYNIVYDETRAVGIFLRGGCCYAGGHAGTGNVFNSNGVSWNAGGGMENQVTTMTVDASANWWGSTDAATVGAGISGNVDYTPWLDGGSETYPGFDGDFSTLYVDDNSAQTGANMRIQEAVDLVTASTVNVMDGTYGADVTTGMAVYITKDGLNLIGQSQSGTVIDGAVGGVGSSGLYWPKGIHVQADNVTLRNLTVQGFTGDLVSSGGYGVLFRDYDHDEPGEGYIYYTGGTVENVTSQDNCYPMYALVHHNLTVRNCQIQNNAGDGMFIARECDGATITDNTVLNSGDHGIWVGKCWTGLGPSDNATITGNAIDGARESGITFCASDGATITGNTITNVAGELYGLGGLSLKDGSSNVTANYNLIYGNDGTWGGHSGTGHGIGIDGTPSNIDLRWNSVYANAGDGCHNYSTVDVGATHCWWGDATGPGGVGPGSGDEITAHVLFDPWIGKAGGENIVCVPDPEYLNVADPIKTVEVKYLGGGGGLVYGYSIKFSWDGSKVSTDPGKVLQGSLLSDMGTTYFFKNPSGTNEITVDCALSGDWPGVSGPGTLFTIEFTGLDVGTSPIDVTVIKVRDKANNPLSGFYEDDGLLVVDVSNPDVTNVLIENLTLAHTDDYIKNTDAARVTATVTDDDPAFGIGNIIADLTGLGDSAAVNPDTYAGGLATWTTALTGVTCTPANGVVTVTVTATDNLGNTDSDSDGIIADNIPPATIANLSAGQVKSGNDADGTTRITLTFTAPGDAYETEVYNAGFGDYPEYDDGTGSEPAGPAYPPAAPWAVTAVTATGQDDEPALRDFWYYVVFTKDIAYNVSAVSNKTTGTLNYHLGDVSDGATPGQGDNYVNSVDFSLMGTSYWKGDGDGGYLNYCDVGPTTDLSTDKLPTTDDKIDFEDLMMFAINFTTVTFTAGGDPEAMPAIERPALRLEWDEQGEDRTDVLVAHLMLEGNSRAVKGLHSEISYDGNSLELVGITAGSLLAEQGAPVFTEHHNGAGLVQFDAAVLGRKLTIRGSGEVAELRFRLTGTVKRLPALKSAALRDFRNRAIRWSVEPEMVDEVVPASTMPGMLSLGASPNPFSGSTRIRLSLPSTSRVSLRVYDVSGRLVRTLADDSMTAGEHNVEWNGRTASGEQVAAGVYVAVLKVEGGKVSQKLFVLP